MKKRMISLLLCLCMVFSLLPTAVLAADDEAPETSVGSEQVTQPDSEKPGDTEGQDKPTGSTESSGKEDSEEKEGSEESGDQSNPGNLEAPIEPVNESEIVATVDGAGYATLADAIKAADGKTLKLEKDVIEAITIPAGMTITLDLNGKTLVNSAEAQDKNIQNSDRKHTITNEGTLRIVDSIGGGIVDNVSHGRAALYNMGTITKIEGGKFTRSVDNSTDSASANGNSWYVVYNDDSAVIEVISGGEFLAIGNFSSLFCNCGLIGEISGGSFKQDGFIAFKNEGTVDKISGGTFSSMNESCIQNWGSIGEITGGTITAGSIGIWNFSSDKYKSVGKVGEISGGNISGSAAAIRLTDYDSAYLNKPSTTNKASITVSGGNIFGNLQINSNTKFSVSGGNFSQPVVKEYLDSNLNAELKRASGETPYSYYASVDDATAAAQPGDSVTDLSAAVGEETVQVTLDYCGEETNTTITVKKGSSLSLPEPTREGYMFLGWFTDAESGDKVTNETSFQESVTIYARWGGEYTITYVYRDKDVANKPALRPENPTTYSSGKGAALNPITSPGSFGKQFLEWRLDTDGDGEGDTAITEIPVGTFGDLTVYAYWKYPVNYTVYDENNETITDRCGTDYVAEDAFEQYSLRLGEQTGYDFDGWYQNTNDFGNTNKRVTAPITAKKWELVGKLTRKEYTVRGKLYLNGKPVMKADGTSQYLSTPLTGLYGDAIDYTSMEAWAKELVLNDIDRANAPVSATVKIYKDGGTWDPSAAFGNPDVSTNYVWVDVTTYYEVVFNTGVEGLSVDTKTVKYGDKVEKPEDPTREGYKFLGWFEKDADESFNFDTSITHKTELTARWEKKTYTVVGKLYLNGKPVMKADGTSQYLSTPLTGLYGEAIDYTSTKTWAENLVLTDIDLANEPIKATVKIYKDGGTWDPSATFGNPDVSPNYVWVDVTTYYEVVFNTGVEGLTVDTQTVKYGDKIEKPEDPTREGYKFLGWFKDGEDTAFDFDTPITHKTELTARWEKKTYTVTFDPNCGAVEPTSKTVTFDDAYGDLPTPTRAHHTFKGWYLGTDKVTEATIVKTAENHTLRAAWSRSYHALTINYVDKKGNPVADSYEASVALGADFSVTSPDVKGYKLRDKDDAVIEGTMTAAGYTYDVVYVKKSSGGSGVQIESPNKPEKDNSLKFNTAEHFAYVNGYPDGTVKPEGNVTRAEVAAILYRVMDADCVKTYETTRCSFSDVVRGDWFNTYVATLENAGVIVDTRTNGKFRPNEAITRAELAAMLAQFADIKSAANSFNDVSARHWASDEIAVCAKMGWINGYPDGSFRPDATITRAEMMAMINRALDRTPKSVSDLLSGMKTWSDNANTGAWYYLDVQEATNSHTYTKSGTHETWKKLH